jgi:hypothetical protein
MKYLVTALPGTTTLKIKYGARLFQATKEWVCNLSVFFGLYFSGFFSMLSERLRLAVYVALSCSLFPRSPRVKRCTRLTLAKKFSLSFPLLKGNAAPTGYKGIAISPKRDVLYLVICL